MNTSALTELEEMDKEATALRSRMNSAAYSFCEMIANDEEEEETCPELKADQRRYRELQYAISDLRLALSISEREIFTLKTLESRVSAPPPRVPADVGLLCSKLIDWAVFTEERTDREDCLISLDLLTGDTQFIEFMMKQNKKILNRESIALRCQLDGMLANMATAAREVFRLGELLKETRPTDSIGPLLLKKKATLKRQIEELGDTHTPLLAMREKLKELAAGKEEMISESSRFGTDTPDFDSDSLNLNERIEEMTRLGEEKIFLENREKELKERGKLVESEIAELERSLTEIEEEDANVRKELDVMMASSKAEELRRERFEMFVKSDEDFEMLNQAAERGSLQDLIDKLEANEKRLEVLENEWATAERNREEFIEQEEAMDAQIATLRELYSQIQTE
jgi:hypothetical protein